jgi:hypothetical protein
MDDLVRTRVSSGAGLSRAEIERPESGDVYFPIALQTLRDGIEHDFDRFLDKLTGQAAADLIKNFGVEIRRIHSAILDEEGRTDLAHRSPCGRRRGRRRGWDEPTVELRERGN